MKTEAYNFLKTARFDRFDVLCRRDYDLWQAELLKLGMQARHVAEDEGVDAKYNTRCLGATPDGQKRLYTFETWGIFSDHWAQVVGDRYWTEVERLDLRIECDVDAGKLLGVADHISKVGKYGRNVQYFDTREREKKAGRHAGGKGVSVGSHKSDRRLVIYKRKGERGAIELQLSGKLLHGLVAAAVSGVADGSMLGSVYDNVMILARSALEKMAKEAGFESAHALVLSIQEPDSYEVPDDFKAEAPVQMLLQGFMDLPHDTQREALRQMTQHHLE